MLIKTTVNYHHIDSSYKNKLRGVLLAGGSRSGKSWSVLQWIIVYCLTNNNKVITIGRDKMTTLKETIFMDFKELINLYNLGQQVKLNRTEMFAELNTNLIRFVGVNDDLMGTHGLKQDIFFLNEAINIHKDTFDQLEQRTTEFFILDYNPNALTHWIYDLTKRNDVLEYTTTVVDNPFAPVEVVKKIKSYEPTEKNILLGTADEFKWKVYGLGLRACSDATIFKVWGTISDWDRIANEYDMRIYGLDFGYSADPTAVVETIISGNNLYVRELLYKTGLTNNEIKEELIDKLDINSYLVCDSAEPKSITELRQLGINATAAVKGPDSIKYGIQKILSYRLFVHNESINLQKELRGYMYSSTKTGEQLNIPKGGNDHLIDSLRYSLTLYS